MSDDKSRLTVEVTSHCYARTVMYRGRVPGLVIDYGGYELALAAGEQAQSIVVAKEFAISLAYAALCFVDACHRMMTAADAEREQR